MIKEELNNNRFLIKINSEISAIVPKENVSFCPTDCPLCGLTIGDAENVSNYLKYDSCENCYLKWGQARSSKWKSGWRPSPQEIKEENKRGNAIPTISISFAKYN